MSDPWSSLQAPGVEATDAPPNGVMPAYSHADSYGRPVVGFDAFMDLPGLCVKCAEPTERTRKLKLRVRKDVLGQLLMRGGIASEHDKLSTGTHILRLPHCSDCLMTYARRKKALTISAFSPLVVLVAFAALSQVSMTAATITAVVGVIVVAPAWRRIARDRFDEARVHVGALDADGFIVLTGVVLETGEAIVKASTRQSVETPTIN